MELVVNKKRIDFSLSEFLTDLCTRVRSLEAKRRSSSEMSTIIASGIAISREVDVAMARTFLTSHKIPVHTIDRVLSGGHRKTDI